MVKGSNRVGGDAICLGGQDREPQQLRTLGRHPPTSESVFGFLRTNQPGGSGAMPERDEDNKQL